MSCRRYERHIALYVGGDLSAWKVRRVEAHLAECAECRRSAASLRASRESLKGLAEAPVPGAVSEAIRLAVARDAEGHTGRQVRGAGFAERTWARRAWGLGLACAAALVAAAVVGVAWLRLGEPARRAEKEARTYEVPGSSADSATRVTPARPEPSVGSKLIDSGRALPSADVADEGESSVLEVAAAASDETPDVPARSAKASPRSVIRLVTDDPNIVILLVPDDGVLSDAGAAPADGEEEMYDGSEA